MDYHLTPSYQLLTSRHLSAPIPEDEAADPRDTEPAIPDSRSVEWVPDQLLHYLQEQQLIDFEGNPLDSFFDINYYLAEEINLVREQLFSLGLSAETSGICFTVDDVKHFYPISLVQLVYEIYQRLGRTRAQLPMPEFIGGAVPHFLTARFYSAYLQKRLNMPEAVADRMVAPFMQSLSGGPNDYDYRQWIEPDEPFLGSKADFKSQFSAIIKDVIESLTGQTISLNIIKDCGFAKFNWVDTDQSKFGIAAIKEFNHVPVECILIEKNDRPYLFTRDRMALVLHMQYNALVKKLEVYPNLVFYDLPNCEQINPEIVLIHQLTMVLDTPMFDGINPRGWLIAMTLSAKGWRALKQNFFPTLWQSFADKNCVLNRVVMASLDEELRWVEENHLCPSGQTDLNLALSIALRINLLFYFIDNDHVINQDHLDKFVSDIRQLLGKRNKDQPIDFCGFALSSLLELLEDPALPYKEHLAWFRIALWATNVSKGMPEGGSSINFGEDCYRFQNHTASVIWIPVKIVESLALISASVQRQQTSRWSERMTAFIDKFLQYESRELIPEETTFKKTIPREELKSFLNILKHSKDPHVLKIALAIELTSKNNLLTVDWLIFMPILIAKYPALLEIFDRSLPKTKPSAHVAQFQEKVVTEPASWLLYLIEAHPHQGTIYSNALTSSDKEKFKIILSELENQPQRYFYIYHKLRHVKDVFDSARVLELLFKLICPGLPPCCSSLSTSQGGRFVPWMIFLLTLKESTAQFRIETFKDSVNSGNFYFFDEKSQIKVYLSSLQIYEDAIRFFQKNSENAKLCLEFFDFIFFQEERPIVIKSTFTLPPSKDKLYNFIKFLRKFDIDSAHYIMGMMLTLYNKSSSQERFQIPAEWLVNYPKIYSGNPHLRAALLQHFERFNMGSPICSLIQKGNVSSIEWAIALTTVKHTNFLKALGILWRTIQDENEEQGELLWNHIKKMLLENIKEIPSLLHILGPIDYNRPSQRRFLFEWISSNKHNRLTRGICVNFIKIELPNIIARKNDENQMQFLTRAARELSFVPETDLSLVDNKTTLTPSQFNFVVDKHFPLLSVYFPYTIATELGRLFYNYLYHYYTEKGLLHPIEFFCLRSVTLHKILLDKFLGYPGDNFCNPEIFQDRHLHYYKLAGVYMLGVTVVAALGIIHHFQSIRTKESGSPSLRRKEMQVPSGNPIISKIKSLAQGYLKPFITLLTLYGVLSAFQYHNNFSNHPKIEPYIKSCRGFAPIYLANELTNAEKLKIMPKDSIVGPLQNGLCDFSLEEHSLDNTIFFISLICQIYLTSLYFGSFAKPLISRTIVRFAPSISGKFFSIQKKTKKRFLATTKTNLIRVIANHRLLFILSNLAYGIFHISSNLEDEFSHSMNAHDRCMSKISYLSPLLAKKVNPYVCPSVKDETIRITFISYIFMYTITACTAAALGYVSFRYNRFSTKIQHKESPQKSWFARFKSINIIKSSSHIAWYNFLALIMMAAVTNYLMTETSKRFGYDRFLLHCHNNVLYEYQKKFNASSALSSDDETRWLTGKLVCGDSSSISHDFIFHLLVTTGFYLAGVLSVSMRKP